jgi:hypothetical protein
MTAGGPALSRRAQAGGQVSRDEATDTWHLSLPAGPAGQYRWAQLDDYADLPRSRFLWNPPLSLSLEARVSAPDLPGTWGFGFWNDPFQASLGLGGAARRLPALPNAAWFFYASPPNYLAFRDDIPAQGLLAATFRSPRLPAPLLAAGLPFVPFLKWRWAARKLRRAASQIIRQDAALLTPDCTQWHTYRLEWGKEQVTFCVDGKVVLETPVSPFGRGGLVLWIDNQYAAFTPQDQVGFGMLGCEKESWLELRKVVVAK